MFFIGNCLTKQVNLKSASVERKVFFIFFIGKAHITHC